MLVYERAGMHWTMLGVVTGCGISCCSVVLCCYVLLSVVHVSRVVLTVCGKVWEYVCVSWCLVAMTCILILCATVLLTDWLAGCIDDIKYNATSVCK